MTRLGFRIPLVILLILCTHLPQLHAFDWAPVSDGEKALKSNPLDPGSGAVVLFKRGQIVLKEVSSLNWITTTYTYTRIKILTDAGKDAANVAIDTEKHTRLSKVEGHTILPSGEIIPLDSSQVFRGQAFKSGSYTEIKTSFAFPSAQPGAIIEYQTEENQDGFYPDPWVFDTDGLGTLQSSLQVLVGPRLGLSQYPLEMGSKLSISRTNAALGTQFDSSATNLHPILYEPFAPPFRDRATMIIFTPAELGFSNDVFPIIEKWDDVGKQMTDYLTAFEKSEKATQDKAKELAEKSPDPRSRAEAIYKYFQQDITSTNLFGFGLGGTADDVVTSKRGGQGEINAAYAIMLKQAKVDAELVVLASKDWGSLARQFPNTSQLTRTVTRVNLKEGALYVDPSDPAAPFGELPWMERGVPALVVKGTKVQQVDIPATAAADNLSTTKMTVQIGQDWNMAGDIEADLKGTEAIDLRRDLLVQTPQKGDEMLTEYLGFGGADEKLSGLARPEIRDTSQPFVVKAHVEANLMAGGGAGNLLLNPWMGYQYRSPVFKANDRHSAVSFPSAIKRVSTSTWQLPLNIRVETLPKDANVKTDLGEFSHSCVQNGSTVTCTRTFQLNKTDITNMVDYQSAKRFFDEIAQHDQEVLVLRRE